MNRARASAVALVLAAGAWPACSSESGDGRDDALAVAPAEAASSRSMRGTAEHLALLRRTFALPPGVLEAGRPASPRDLRPDVVLPAVASDPVRIVEPRTGAEVRVALDGAAPRAREDANDVSVFRDAFGPGADVIHQRLAVGVEDFVVLRASPGRVSYTLELARVAGLRLVERSLELLDARGTPRLRMAPPYLVTVSGRRVPVDVSVSGCAFDADASAPWRRPVTPPGSDSCRVELTWRDADVDYPALLDPAWTTTASMAIARENHTAALIGATTVLVAGGTDNVVELANAELYDVQSDTFATTGSLAVAREAHTATTLDDGRVLIAGGTPTTPTAELFVGTGFVAASTPLHVHDWGTATKLSDGRVLVAGGYTSSRTAEIFDPGTGAWTATPLMAFPHADHAATILADGRVLQSAGCSSEPTNQHELYDPASDAWITLAPATTKRCWHTATLLANGDVLLAGGIDQQWYNQAASEVFTPPAGNGMGSFAPTLAFAPSRSYPRATRLPNGQVLLVGGWDDDANAMGAVTTFVPSSGAFTQSTAMSDIRYWHTLTDLPGGGNLVIGGQDANGPTATTELHQVANVGGACTTDGDCANGTCVDGFCCDSACKGPCESCSAAEKGSGTNGTCGPLASGAADAACAPDPAAPCGPTGACVAGGACEVAAKGVTCGLVVCADSQVTSSLCDGMGSCHETTTSCDPYGCADGASCATGCTDDAGCASGSYCAGDGTCKPRRGVGEACMRDTECESGACSEAGTCASTGCEDDKTLRLPDGTLDDCTPYLCRAGRCLTTCESVLDCAPVNVCDEHHVCVPPPSPVILGGCTVGAERERSGSTAAFLAVAALALFGARRRR